MGPNVKKKHAFRMAAQGSLQQSEARRGRHETTHFSSRSVAAVKQLKETTGLRIELPAKAVDF